MACGDVTPNDVYLPTCGLSTMRITKSASLPNAPVVLPGDLITYIFLIESMSEGPAGISFEDIFTDCAYLESVLVTTPGWALTVDGLNPCRFIIDNPLAVNPGVHVVTMTAIAGDSSVPPAVGFGDLVNTANVLTPTPVAGNELTIPFGPLLRGNVPDQVVGVPVNYQYEIASGVAPFVVSLAFGILPLGLTISAAGLLSGTPTTADDYDFTLQLLDGNGNTYLLSDACEVV